MTIDDLRELARLADGVDGHSPDRLTEVHRRIDRAQRRRAASVVAAVVVAVAVVAGSFALGNLTSRTPDPARSHQPQPSPTRSESERPVERFHPAEGTERLTPRQTVLSYNARLQLAVAALDDPDVRVSLWETTCFACPPPCEGCRPNPTFRAIAVTDDSYRTTRYLRPQMLNLESIIPTSRPAFLLDDEANGRQRLLTPDGRMRKVRVVDGHRSTKDPGLVVPCHRTVTEGRPNEAVETGWCVLDVKTATATPLPATWVEGRSTGRPGLGQEPWGIEYVYPAPGVGYDRAWWTDGGARRYADVPRTPLLRAVHSLSRDDTPTYLHWSLWSDRADVYVVRDRSGGLRKIGSRPWLPLRRAELAEVGHPNELAVLPGFARTPDGGLLAWSNREGTTSPGLTVWRADSLTRGAFETVYVGGRSTGYPWRDGLDLTVHDGRIYLDTLVSDDDGRTWTEPVTTWRP